MMSGGVRSTEATSRVCLYPTAEDGKTRDGVHRLKSLCDGPFPEEGLVFPRFAAQQPDSPNVLV